MVTSHKINENEMGYRGSKSVLKITTVKEQRVDGSWCVNSKNTNEIIHLRYTLMGCESNNRIKILSKQLSINILSFSLW